jgi:hypothetical protein
VGERKRDGRMRNIDEQLREIEKEDAAKEIPIEEEVKA